MTWYVIRYDKLWWVVVRSWVCLSWVVMMSPRQWGQPGASLHCACHTKPSRGPTAPTSTIAPQECLCTGKKYSLLRLPCDLHVESAIAVGCWHKKRVGQIQHWRPTRWNARPNPHSVSPKQLLNVTGFGPPGKSQQILQKKAFLDQVQCIKSIVFVKRSWKRY